ncbi:MAG: hypothetical protein LBD60_03375 [Puniceicoccales bacterium]|jgi:transaldolase|nr:hypothetical protein [Puniceicoccales bacterium]
MDLLEQLKTYSTILADTCDLGVIEEFQPRDATINPSIVFKTVIEHPYFLNNILSHSVERVRWVLENNGDYMGRSNGKISL